MPPIRWIILTVWIVLTICGILMGGTLTAAPPGHRGNCPDTLGLHMESGFSGLGHPFPTALSDPAQAMFSWLAYPPLLPPDTLDAHGFEISPVAQLRSSSQDRIWTLRLKADSRWGDGKPLRATDVATSLENLLSSRIGSPYAILFRHILGFDEFRKGEAEHLEGLQILDSLTVQILLSESDPDMARRLAHPSAGLVRWPRRVARRRTSGPVAWIPVRGRPAPQGLAPVEWVTKVGAASSRLASAFKTTHPFDVTLKLHPGRRLSGTETGLPLLFTGPVLPIYCPGSRTKGEVLAETHSLLILIMRPRVGEEAGEQPEVFHSGFSWDQRLTIAQHLTTRRDLLPYTEDFVPAEGFLDNPPGYVESIVSATRLEGVFGLRKESKMRLMYAFGDMSQRCVARRLAALLSEIQEVQVSAGPREAVVGSLQSGDFDMALISLPSMAWTRWESTAIMMGLLDSHLWKPMRPYGMEDWFALPVDPAGAEAHARHLEGIILEEAIILPIGWMKTRLLLEPEFSMEGLDLNLPWHLESFLSLLGGGELPQERAPHGR